jgi:hypothetical protein
MEIIIDGKLATLKKGTSFEYVAENRLFTGSDSYTLSISFPLKDCLNNQDIFGNINRADVEADKVIFDTEIREYNFSKFGVLAITEISESEVKAQFLEGRSAQNFDTTFDDIYINELDLGEPEVRDKNLIFPEDAWNKGVKNLSYVALPWWGDGNTSDIQNKIKYVDGIYLWDDDCTGLSWQPYLIYIAKQICRASEIGYDFDFSQWENHKTFKYLLICNSVPYAWDVTNFARVLPHWTVAEFFEKLELLLRGQFDIDHKAKKISFSFYDNILEETSRVELEDIIDEHQTDVTVEDPSCNYILNKNIVYKSEDSDIWYFYSCNKFLRSWDKNKIESFSSIQELLKATIKFKNIDWDPREDGKFAPNIYYAEDLKVYFIIKILKAYHRVIDSDKAGTKKRYGWNYICKLRPLNLLGGHIVNDDDDETEIEFTPVRIDETEDTYGDCMFLSYSSYDEDVEDDTEEEVDASTLVNNPVQPIPVQHLKKVESEDGDLAEYYSQVYIGYWDGKVRLEGKLPYPLVENIYIDDDWNLHQEDFSLRLNCNDNSYIKNAPMVVPEKKFTFKFLSDEMPNALAIFFIRGKKYICSKLTGTFTESGMSRLIKGEFYKVVD